MTQLGQRWRIINIDRRSEAYIRGAGRKLSDFFTYDQEHILRDLLVPYASPQVCAWLSGSSSPRAPPKAGLLSLPTELLHMIVNETYRNGAGQGALDVICLAATCQRFFHIVAPLLDEIRAALSCNWGQCRIVCIGEYTQAGDIPPGMLTEEEEQEIEDKSVSPAPREKYAFLDLLGLREESAHGDHTAWSEFCAISDNCTGHVPRQISDADGHVCRRLLRPHYPTRTDWMVCNWSKFQYVQAQAIADLCGRPNAMQPFLHGCPVKLWHVVLSQICWSSEGCITMPDNSNGDLHRGPWAGDIFTITTLERLSSEEKARFEDVSVRVVHDLTEVFRSEYGTGDAKKWPVRGESARTVAKRTSNSSW